MPSKRHSVRKAFAGICEQMSDFCNFQAGIQFPKMEQSEIETMMRSMLSIREISIFSKSTSIVSGYASGKYFQRIEVMEWTFAIFMMLQLLLLHFYFQLDLQANAYALIFSHVALGVGLLLVLTIIFQHFSRGQYDQIRNINQQNLSDLIVNILLLLVMPYPFLNDVLLNLETPTLVSYSESEYSFKLNYLLIMLTVFRNCFFATSVLIKSKYMSPRAQRICNMYGARPGAIFCLRCVFKDSPFAFITTIFVASVAIFSFLFRIAEYQTYSNSVLTMYANMAWMTVITMTSVGYGDYTPKTPFGRLIGAICVSWGVLIVSVMVVVLTNAFSMNRNESQSLNILNKLEKNSALREKAAAYLREGLWRIWKNYKLRLSVPSRLKERKRMQAFRLCRRERDMAAVSESEIDFYNEMVRQFERAFVNLNNLTSNNLKIIDYLNEQYIFKEGLTTENALMLLKK